MARAKRPPAPAKPVTRVNRVALHVDIARDVDDDRPNTGDCITVVTQTEALSHFVSMSTQSRGDRTSSSQAIGLHGVTGRQPRRPGTHSTDNGTQTDLSRAVREEEIVALLHGLNDVLDQQGRGLCERLDKQGRQLHEKLDQQSRQLQELREDQERFHTWVLNVAARLSRGNDPHPRQGQSQQPQRPPYTTPRPPMQGPPSRETSARHNNMDDSDELCGDPEDPTSGHSMLLASATTSRTGSRPRPTPSNLRPLRPSPQVRAQQTLQVLLAAAPPARSVSSLPSSAPSTATDMLLPRRTAGTALPKNSTRLSSTRVSSMEESQAPIRHDISIAASREASPSSSSSCDPLQARDSTRTPSLYDPSAAGSASGSDMDESADESSDECADDMPCRRSRRIATRIVQRPQPPPPPPPPSSKQRAPTVYKGPVKGKKNWINPKIKHVVPGIADGAASVAPGREQIRVCDILDTKFVAGETYYFVESTDGNRGWQRLGNLKMDDGGEMVQRFHQRYRGYEAGIQVMGTRRTGSGALELQVHFQRRGVNLKWRNEWVGRNRVNPRVFKAQTRLKRSRADKVRGR